jgi:hypothetical protein
MLVARLMDVSILIEQKVIAGSISIIGGITEDQTTGLHHHHA